VGSPTMNFVPGRIESGVFTSSAGSFQLPVPASALAGEEARGEIVLGFRPQSVVAGESTPGAFEAKVELTEPLGDQVDLRLDIGAGEPIGARMPMTSIPAAGQTMRITIKPDDMMLFEPGEFGRRLGSPKAASRVKVG